jgi:two-component system, OmpR family, response regulator
MLVISRRLHEKVLFPSINVSVQVVSTKQGMVRLGIEAPPDVAIFRQEVLDRIQGQEVGEPPISRRSAMSPLDQMIHRIRNRLNTATVGLALLRRQFHASVNRIGLETTLDKVEQEIQALKEQLEERVEPTVAQPSTSPRRALVVEDDVNECELMAGFLRMAGLDVATAGDGASALEYLQTNQRPDVVLLDMVLPRLDGQSTVRVLRGNPAYASLKIFGVTAHAPDRFDLDQGPGGVDRWFRKPLNPEVLLGELNKELELTE